MTNKIIIISSGLFGTLLVIALVSQGDWHLKRNKHNKLPFGMLSQKTDSLYLDENKVEWILQPHNMNIFHQPETVPVPAPPIPIPFPNVQPPLDYDPNHPNRKLLSRDGKGGSYEAILKPDGSYLITGKKQGTYNYSNPSGFLGFVKHTIFDVIPHFFTSKYDDSLNQ